MILNMTSFSEKIRRLFDRYLNLGLVTFASRFLFSYFRSNAASFVKHGVFKPNKTHHPVKVQRNLTSSFEVIGNFLIEKYENSFHRQR